MPNARDIAVNIQQSNDSFWDDFPKKKIKKGQQPYDGYYCPEKKKDNINMKNPLYHKTYKSKK